MKSDVVPLIATIILLFPMSYFLLTSPTFLLVKLDVPEVAQLMQGHFRAYFLMVTVAGAIATLAFAVAGRPVFAAGTAAIAAAAFGARRWFLPRMDAELSARAAGDADAARRLRRLHVGGMLSNAIQLAVVAGCIPFVAST